MMPRVTGLSAGFPLALVLAAAPSLLAGQSVGGRWLGGVRGVALAQLQLPLQIRDLLLGVRNLLLTFADLFFALGDFTAEFFILSLQPLIFTLQLLPAGSCRLPMAIRRCSGWPCTASR